jgi:hypothetical protein
MPRLHPAAILALFGLAWPAPGSAAGLDDLPQVRLAVVMAAGSFGGYSGPLLHTVIDFGPAALRVVEAEGVAYGSLAFADPHRAPGVDAGPLYIPFTGAMRLVEADSDASGRRLESALLRSTGPGDQVQISLQRRSGRWTAFIIVSQAGGATEGVAYLEE